MKLSENFSLEEITDVQWSSLTVSQREMVNNIVLMILQPIRNTIKTSITITSGMRDTIDFFRLKENGYNPSETSDHFYGRQVPLYSIDKLSKFGPTYSFAVGACDIQAKGMTVNSLFEIITHMNKVGQIKCGQIIREMGSGKEWVHISNPMSLIYSDWLINKYLVKQTYLVSNDAGKTYQPIGVA
jgi:hypothetical protein